MFVHQYFPMFDKKIEHIKSVHITIGDTFRVQ